ncbi:hypothetical protein ACLGIH_34245 [Streptomyces sp. HMX87]|uniref:hypothetical protein n=1 Tax=Streptomyces sp. HMX87 TaxID=3390849 RepID=UPI003A8AF975
MRPRETLTESQGRRLLEVRPACPDLTRVCDLARVFADLVRHRRGHLLLEWIRQAEQDAPKPMQGFGASSAMTSTPSGAGLTLEFWLRRRTRESDQNTQASDVRPGLVRPPSVPHPDLPMRWRSRTPAACTIDSTSEDYCVAERGLDSSWLHAWCQEVSQGVSGLMGSFEETHGYPAGNNNVAPADDETRAAVALLANHRPEHGALLSLYAVIDSVSMPDIGNGYFIHPPSTVTEHLDEYGAVPLTNGAHGVVFGSDGGGRLFALTGNGAVHKSRTAAWNDDFYSVAADLRDFLEQLRRAVEQFAVTGAPGAL